MDRKNKLIAFIGLSLLVSISLHSFAHTNDNILEVTSQIECQACENDHSASMLASKLIAGEAFGEAVIFAITQTFYLKLNKPFYSQAPPKI